MKNTLIDEWRQIQTDDKILTKELEQKDHVLSDSFASNMEFGTAGIRGIMGAGTNKMNIHTVAAAAQAYAKFLIKNVGNIKRKGVVVGHDNRYNSKLFSETTANILLNNGIKAYLFEDNELQPTPLISYVIRRMKLGGGVIITASHNPKKYNGFKVYNELGGQLMPKFTKEIQNNMDKLDVLKIKKETSKQLSYIPTKILDEYLKDIVDKVKLRNDKMKIKVAFSPLHGTTGILVPKVLEKLDIEHFEVEKQMLTCPDFKYTKTSNPEEAKAYTKVVALARRKKADIALVTDPDGDRIGAVVKYQRRYKYLNGNQMAALYLDYKLTQMKSKGNLPKDAYIVKSVVSGNLPVRIAEKFGVKVIETHVGFKNISEVMEKTSGTFIMGYEESYGFVFDKNISRDKDSLQGIVGLTEMVNYYKLNNINTYEHLKDLWQRYGIHRTTQISKKMDDDMTNRLLKRFSKMKTIAGKKVVEIQDYRKGFNSLEVTNLVKVILKDGSWLAIRPSGTEPKVKIYIQTVGSKNSELIDVVIFEKEVKNFLDDNTETFDVKHWSWKSFFKYVIFISIIIGIMLFVFLEVYASASGDSNVVDNAKTIFKRQNSFIWLSIFLFAFFNIFLNALIRKRLIDFQGQKVKIKHLAITVIMGSIISYITPFAIGGDAIGYWYLRRKGFKRGPLLASFMSSTIIYQFGILLQSAILIPTGIPIYQEILGSSDPQSHAALILFIIGICWNIFAAFMIFSLTIWRGMQEFIVRNSLKLLEWTRFVTISDPGAIASTYQYEFSEMRIGFKKIWTKKLLIIEIICYELMFKFINGGAILTATAGVTNGSTFFEQYWNQIVAGDISGTANSLSLTPGGSGTGEWLTVVVNKHIFNENVVGVDGASKGVASSMDFIWKCILIWPMLLISTLMVFNVIIRENRKSKFNVVDKNKRLKGLKIVKRLDKSIYLFIALWGSVITAFLTVFFMV